MANRFVLVEFSACAALIVTMCAGAAGVDAQPKISVEQAPPIVVVTRDVTGNYDQAPRVFAELSRVTLAYRTSGVIFGIYPVDPDTTHSPNELHWQAAIRVVRSSVPAVPPKPYRLEVLKASTVAVVESTVGRAGRDGLSVIPWMARNGYVQIAPTRMEFHRSEGASQSIPVRIIVPIEKRKSRLKAGG